MLVLASGAVVRLAHPKGTRLEAQNIIPFGADGVGLAVGGGADVSATPMSMLVLASMFVANLADRSFSNTAIIRLLLEGDSLDQGRPRCRAGSP